MEKAEIIGELERSREEFLDAIAGLEDEEMLEPGVVGDWSIKDILAHISRWEGELITMLYQARAGKKSDRQEIRNKEQIDELNARWYQESRDRPLDLIQSDFRGLRPQTVRRVSEFSDEELNDPGLYEWLRGAPLWRWIAVDTFEHEREHAEQIREWRADRTGA